MPGTASPDTFDRGGSPDSLTGEAQADDSGAAPPGAHVLELGTANGVRRVLIAAPSADGQVTGIDSRRGCRGRRTRRGSARRREREIWMDAADLAFKPATFDAVICKWSLEQSPTRTRQLSEALRIFGSLEACWRRWSGGRPERSSFSRGGPLEIFRIDPKLITAEAGAPSTFELAAEGALEAAYNAAGFANVQSQTLTLMITCADGESYWDLIANGNGFMKHKLDLAGPAVAAKARLATIATASSFSAPTDRVAVRGL